MPKTIRSYPYQFGTDLPLDDEGRDDLIRLFEKTPQTCDDILGGRAQVAYTTLANVGPVVVKYYKRGGLIRHLSRDAFFRSGKPRPLLEYEMLERVRALGIQCPEPLIWAIRGGMFYRAFLVTRQIPDARTLADIGLETPPLCDSLLLRRTADQIAGLIANRIHHVDLHPGNVLVDAQLKVHVIDFDKARVSTLNPKKLRAAYIARWARSVRKHNLPPHMTECLIEALDRRNDTDTQNV